MIELRDRQELFCWYCGKIKTHELHLNPYESLKRSCGCDWFCLGCDTRYGQAAEIVENYKESMRLKDGRTV